MSIATEVAFPIPANKLIERKVVGRYVVEAFLFQGLGQEEPVWRVLLNGRKVRCWTRSQEQRFPRRPAATGNAIVERYKRTKGGGA